MTDNNKKNKLLENEQYVQPPFDHSQNEKYQELMQHLLQTMGEVNEKWAEQNYLNEFNELYKEQLKEAKKVFPEQMTLVKSINRSLKEQEKQSKTMLGRGAYKLLGASISSVASKIDDLTDIPVLKQMKTVGRFVNDVRNEHKNKDLSEKREEWARATAIQRQDALPASESSFTVVERNNEIKDVTTPSGHRETNAERKERLKPKDRSTSDIAKDVGKIQEDVREIKEHMKFKSLLSLLGMAFGATKSITSPLKGLTDNVKIGSKKALCCCSDADFDRDKRKKNRDKRERKKSKTSNKTSVSKTQPVDISKDTKTKTSTNPTTNTSSKTSTKAAKTGASASMQPLARKAGTKIAQKAGVSVIARLALAAGGVVVGGLASPLIAVAGGLYTAYEVADALGVTDYVGDQIKGLTASTTDNTQGMTATASSDAKRVDEMQQVSDQQKQAQQVKTAETQAAAQKVINTGSQAVVTSVTNNTNSTNHFGSSFNFDQSHYQSSFDRGVRIIR